MLTILFYLSLQILFSSQSNSQSSGSVSSPFLDLTNYFPKLQTFSGTQNPLYGMNCLLHVQQCSVWTQLLGEVSSLDFLSLLTLARNLTPLSSIAKFANSLYSAVACSILNSLLESFLKFSYSALPQSKFTSFDCRSQFFSIILLYLQRNCPITASFSDNYFYNNLIRSSLRELAILYIESQWSFCQSRCFIQNSQPLLPWVKLMLLVSMLGMGGLWSKYKWDFAMLFFSFSKGVWQNFWGCVETYITSQPCFGFRQNYFVAYCPFFDDCFGFVFVSYQAWPPFFCDLTLFLLASFVADSIV